MMRERCACDRLVSTISASMKAEVRISPPQAARENASRIASDMMPKAMVLRNDFAEFVRDHALQREQRRQDQERAEHVRVLEGAAGAVVERQQIMSAGDQVEIAGDGRVAAIIAPTTRPRRSMSSRAAVSSETTIAKKITVTAMYQEVAIQVADAGPVDRTEDWSTPMALIV